MERRENPMKRSNDERGRGRCGSFESSGRKIAYTGLASEHNKGDERSFIKGKKFCPAFCRGSFRGAKENPVSCPG